MFWRYQCDRHDAAFDPSFIYIPALAYRNGYLIQTQDAVERTRKLINTFEFEVQRRAWEAAEG